MRTNSGDTCCAAAVQHQGIVLQPLFLVGPHLLSGALVENGVASGFSKVTFTGQSPITRSDEKMFIVVLAVVLLSEGGCRPFGFALSPAVIRMRR
jgi:hypothetical protein